MGAPKGNTHGKLFSKDYQPGGSGRPTKLSQEHIDTVNEFADMLEKKFEANPNEIDGVYSASPLTLCLTLKISRETIYNWMRADSGFLDSVNRVRMICQLWWEHQGLNGSMGNIDGFKHGTYAFMMKNKFRRDWSDTIKIGGDGGDPIQIAKVKSIDDLYKEDES